MRRTLRSALFVSVFAACGGDSKPAESGEPKVAETKAVETKPVEAKAVEAKAVEAKPVETKPIEAKPVEAPATPRIDAQALPVAEPAVVDEPAKLPDAAPAVAPPEIPIQPWATTPHTLAWTLAAEPGQSIVFAPELFAGVLGRAGDRWMQAGADGVLAPVEMSVEPKPPLLGVWPSDAWYVDERMRKLDDGSDMEYLELRLMKLRGNGRWVPQVYSGTGEQWFHPGTDDEDEPHISTLSGLLVYPASLSKITRVAGKHEDPVIGPHRGDVVDFIEAASGKVYVLSRDAEGFYAQTACEDEACVATAARKLPLLGWKFGRKVARGKHSISVMATQDNRDLILNHRGKSEGWRLDALPGGEKTLGMWSSQEGGLWTWTGAVLRWRDIDGVWRDITMPEGFTPGSVAMALDRKQVWVSGEAAGAAKVYTTPADPPKP